jgi:hypothetical protein
MVELVETAGILAAARQLLAGAGMVVQAEGLHCLIWQQT